jgi:hypothetical protein
MSTEPYGFQISIQDIIGIVVFLAVVFGLAALILVFGDKVTLKPNMSGDQRQAAITRRSERLQRGWAIAFFIMALIALPVQAFGLKDEPLSQRLLFLALAALIIINFLFSWHNSRNQEGSGKESAIKTSDDEE